MAATQIGPSLSTVTLPTGYAGDVQRFTVNESQAFENTSPVGTNTCGRVMGNGLSTISVTASGFLRTTGTPGFGKSAVSGNDYGQSATWLYYTGMSIAGTFMVSNISSTLDRLRGGVAFDWVMQGNSDMTFTWA